MDSRALVLLAAAVLVAHLLLLRATPPVLGWASPVAPAPAPQLVRIQLASRSATWVREAQAPVVEPAPRAEPRATRAASPAAAPLAPPVTATPAAADPPAPARWRYAALAMHRGIALHGQATLDWMPVSGTYEAVLTIDVPGLPRREQRSSGDVEGVSGLLPRRFGDRVRSEQAAHFERGSGQLLFSGNQPAAMLESGAQDRLSVIVQLLALLRADAARLAPGTTVRLQVVTARGADTWAFRVDGWEALDLPGGGVSALRLTRPPAREYDLRMELWISADYGPVRLRLTPPNGDWLDLQWSGTDKR